MIKLFEQYKEYDQIKEWLDKMGISNYTINDDLIVDVDGSVNLYNKRLTEIPVQFGKVREYFFCNYNELTSLKGCPTSVGGDFNCNSTQITSLEGCPTSVGGHFGCSDCKLTSLKGVPLSITRSFYCDNNELTSLEGGPTSVGGIFIVKIIN